MPEMPHRIVFPPKNILGEKIALKINPNYINKIKIAIFYEQKCSLKYEISPNHGLFDFHIVPLCSYNRPVQMQVNEEDFDDAIRMKVQRGSNSGYLDQEYETTKEFPNLHDFHFRIEDQHQIIRLQNLHQHSQPIAMQHSFGNSSDGFKGRLDQLISQLDQHRVALPNTFAPESHGYYQLADHYDDQSAIESVLQKANIQQVRQNIQEMQIEDLKPTFIKRPARKKKGPAMQMQKEEGEVKKLCRKMNKITITEQDC